jgi:hypothetical protein
MLHWFKKLRIGQILSKLNLKRHRPIRQETIMHVRTGELDDKLATALVAKSLLGSAVDRLEFMAPSRRKSLGLRAEYAQQWSRERISWAAFRLEEAERNI